MTIAPVEKVRARYPMDRLINGVQHRWCSCIKCSESAEGGEWKPITEFRIDRQRHGAMPQRKRICKVGEVTARDQRRRESPYRHSFIQRRRSHASRLGLSVKELEALGWDADRRSIEMEAVFKYGFCPLCIEIVDGEVQVHYFRDMKGGLSDLTIDVINPELLPVWPGNVQWVDDVCNKRKGHDDPILHGQRLQAEHELRLAEVGWAPVESQDSIVSLGPASKAQRTALELTKTDTPTLFG